MLISNIREDGKQIGALPDGEMHFHTDQCHQERPAMATMLYSIEVPSVGGNTCSPMPMPPMRRCPPHQAENRGPQGAQRLRL